jgi:hypothetical protein
LRNLRKIHRRIARHLESEGYEVEEGETAVGFRSGRITGTVRIVEEDGTMADLLSATLEAYHDSTKGMLAYVAAPSPLIDRMGIHVFRLYGLGLLVYSDDHVEEMSRRGCASQRSGTGRPRGVRRCSRRSSRGLRSS